MIRPGPAVRGIRLLALAAVALVLTCHANADELRLGLAEVDITPPVGMRMADNFQ